MFDDDEFKTMVLDEITDHSNNVYRIVQDAGVDIDESFLKELFRILHSIKGTSKSGGFEDIAHITHLVENLVGRLKLDEVSYSEVTRDFFLDFADELLETIQSLRSDYNHQKDFSIFEERLDALLNSDHTPVQSSEENVDTGYQHSILIIDDEEGIVDLIEGFYQEIYTDNAFTKKCYDGVDGANAARERHYDLIVLDFCMGGKNGLEVLQEIRDSGCPNLETPVIFLSAFHPDMPLDKSLRDKVFFIEKPFTFDSFNFYCKLLIERPKLQAA